MENKEEVKKFYKKTNPWGFWGPIRKEVQHEDPEFMPNNELKKDLFNILIGIIWQMAQVVIPIYFMIRQSYELMAWSVVLITTTWLLKKYWWDRLKDVDSGYETDKF